MRVASTSVPGPYVPGKSFLHMAFLAALGLLLLIGKGVGPLGLILGVSGRMLLHAINARGLLV